MANITVKGNDYRTSGKLSAMDQFHVARKLVPVLASLTGAFEGLSPDEAQNVPIGKILPPLSEALSSLPDADCDAVISRCLSVVERRNGNVWSKVWNAQVKAMQFEDIELQELFQLVIMVIQENLAPFITALPGNGQSETPSLKVAKG